MADVEKRWAHILVGKDVLREILELPEDFEVLAVVTPDPRLQDDPNHDFKNDKVYIRITHPSLPDIGNSTTTPILEFDNHSGYSPEIVIDLVSQNIT